MQSQQIVAHHSSRSSTRRNTQSIPLLAGLFCASLTGCILEERNGSDAPNPPSPPDLRTLPDLRADLLPSPDLAAPCGSDGIFFNGKCIYDFYQLQQGATSCAGKSITLYDPGSQFKQVCDCACDRSTLVASLVHGDIIFPCATKSKDILASASCTRNLSTSGGYMKYEIKGGSCQETSASQTSWKFDKNKGASYTYCLLSTEARRTSSQECVIIDGSSAQCPSGYNTKGPFGFSPQNQSLTLISCSCCAPSDYPEQPIIVYEDNDCTGNQMSTFPQLTCGPSGFVAASAKWNQRHCPLSYLKTLPAPFSTVATQTVCCKQ